MDFLHKLLGRVGNTVNNDVVKPIQRTVNQVPRLNVQPSQGQISPNLGSGIIQNPQEITLQQKYNPGYIPLQSTSNMPSLQGSEFNQQQPQVGVTGYYIKPLVDAQNQYLNTSYGPYHDLSGQQPAPPSLVHQLAEPLYNNLPADYFKKALNVLLGR